MENKNVKMVDATFADIYFGLKEIHQTFHLKMRLYLDDKNMLDDFYEYFPECKELDAEYENLINSIKEHHKQNP
ncbi:MAG: hypothetical protein OEZ01_15980 [Candidatus Heimdallarchaeota archaeon]|nr:hypothetical protein [Candidatus Heimdallarchaeota archaeon]